ncbi:MAG: hypothetical protein IT386_17230 [Deltaproteobacteria bacterium]|nr:hypothetical protein [Deltaproteobacteria bacterium]
MIGLLLTALWLGGGAFYLGAGMGWRAFFDQPLGEMGDFLDGAFAPLAFLWLVLGLFMQQRELAENNRAIQQQYEIMQRTAENAEIQTRAIAANELHARQDTFMDLVRLVGIQLEVIAGMLYLSSQGSAGDGIVSDDEMDTLWGRLGSGEISIFSRRLIGLRFGSATPSQKWALFYGTPIRTRHCETFIHSFERLARTANDCDPDGMITDALHGNAQGRLYRVMCELRTGPPAP